MKLNFCLAPSWARICKTAVVPFYFNVSNFVDISGSESVLKVTLLIVPHFGYLKKYGYD